MSINVKSLHIHPVKSLRRITLKRAKLLPTGLHHDRSWLLVDGNGQFLSQRRVPRMAQISTALGDEGLILAHEEYGQCQAPLRVSASRSGQTEVWGDVCQVDDQGDEVAHWLASVLGANLAPRLVRLTGNTRRPQRHPDRYGAGTHTIFADSAPYLVANLASLNTLNTALIADQNEAISMDRFRANIVIDGLAAFKEHSLESLHGPGYSLSLRYPRERCVITTMDQASGEKNPANEPFRTLCRINPMPDNPKGPAFGELAVLSEGSGAWVSVGDELKPGWK